MAIRSCYADLVCAFNMFASPVLANVRRACLISLAGVALATAIAQNHVQAAEPTVNIRELPLNQPKSIDYEFQFARMRYQGGWEWPRWQADWPEAEFHFSNGLERLTNVKIAPDSVVVSLMDDSLFEHPWLYVVEVGFWTLSAPERSNLKEYLLRGGFLMVDDFHGPLEWANFASVIRQVFPDRRIVPLSEHSSLFNIHFDLHERVQIPGIRSVMNNRTWEKGGVNAGWYGVLDDQHRIMIAINFNQDIGDAWEHADDARYPHQYTALAYRMGVNYVIYAMSH